MINRCGLLRKREDMSMEQFRQFWFYEHGPIGSQMKNLRHYEQNLVVRRLENSRLPAGSIDIDGFSELWFDDIHDMEEGVNSLNGAGAADLVNFVSDCKVVVYEKKVDKAVPDELKGRKLLKRTCFLSRAEGVSNEKFQNEWWGRQSELMKSVPGYVGYAQNLVIDRIVNGEHTPREVIPYDGMVEFYFKDQAGYDECFGSEAFKAVSAHVPTFVGKVNSYIIEAVHYPIPGEE